MFDTFRYFSILFMSFSVGLLFCSHWRNRDMNNYSPCSHVPWSILCFDNHGSSGPGPKIRDMIILMLIYPEINKLPVDR